MSANAQYEILSEACQFLSEVSWLFDFSNIKVFESDVVERWPTDWRNFLVGLSSVQEMKDVLLGRSHACPPFVQQFVRRRTLLLSQLDHLLGFEGDADLQDESEMPKIGDDLKRGMNPKKQHEVLHFAQHIHKQVQQSDCHIVDIGSGLGYVDQILSRNWGHSVYGVESSLSHSERARERAQIYTPETNQLSFTLDNSQDSFVALEKLIPTDKTIFLIGLHSCGDLTPNMLRWFEKSSTVTGISVVSCCYHKICDSSSYPMSKCFKCIAQNWNPLRSVYAKRLAAQDSFESWIASSEETHFKHAQTFGRRSLLEMFASRRDLKVEKTRRKCGRLKQNGSFVAETLEKFVFRSKLTSEVIPQDELESNLVSLFHQYQDKFLLLELMTGLQGFLQILLEMLIVADRITFLEELGYKPKVERLFDKKCSPRGYVITCKK